MSKMSKGALVVLVALTAFAARGFADEVGGPNNRFLLLTLGAGLSMPSYGPELDSALSIVSAGNTRVDVYVDLGVGIALTRDLFILLKGNGFGTRIEDTYGNYVQLNLVSVGGAIRLYPFVNGLFLEAGVGASKIVLEGSAQSLLANPEVQSVYLGGGKA